MKHEIPHIRASGGGAILNTASAAVLKASPDNPDYQASKAGVVALSRAAALTHAADGIRVNALLPGPTMTPMMMGLLTISGRTPEQAAAPVPMKRMGTPEELANAAVWLCSDEASYVTGVSMVVDGGYSL